jgi:subtilisin
VLVVDSGVDDHHPEFAASRVMHFAVEEFANGGLQVVPATSHDPIGHGTAVASIVRRYAPDAELTSVRILGRKNLGTTEHLFTALDWAVRERFDVINTSLGTTYLALLAKFKPRIDAAYLSGAILVSACSNLDAEIIEYPAHFTSVISVSAATLAPLALERTAGMVEFRAAGVDVPVAWRMGSVATVTGSSFAAPHVTALVARLREQYPQWNATQMKAALYELAAPAATRSSEPT